MLVLEVNEPSSGLVVAPVSGTVTTVADAKHAVGTEPHWLMEATTSILPEDAALLESDLLPAALLEPQAAIENRVTMVRSPKSDER